MERIRESVDEVGRFGEVFQKLTSGSDEMNEPIALTLLPIHVAVNAHFYKALTLRFSCRHTEEFLEKRKKHINKILCKYPRLKKAFRAIGKSFSMLLIRFDLLPWLPPGGGGVGVLPYMSYIGTCRCEGYGFQAVYSRIGYINQSVWV